jgi:hypothetical protein
MKNFRTYNMALELYRKGQDLPLKGELRDQFERASLSVVLNLAEGSVHLHSWPITRPPAFIN